MKKTILTLLLLIMILSLAACGSTAAQTGAGELSTGDTSLSMRLAIGTLLLVETEYAVTSAQAAELLSLWQAAQTLNESGSAADVEITSLYNQIQAALSPEQIEQIEAMAISSENTASLLESLGISMGLGDRNSDENQDGEGFTPPDGVALEGGGPGGEMPAEMQNLSDEERQALREEGMGNGAGGEANPMLIAAVIQVLSDKVAQ